MRFILYIIVLLAALPACQKQGFADPDQIHTLISKANCKGPFGTYTTECHASKDGYIFLRQSYDYREDDYAAVAYNVWQGYNLDENLVPFDTTSQQVIQLLRSYAYHMMAVDPDWYFYNLKFDSIAYFQGIICDLHSGTDYFGQPVQVYYDHDTKLLAGCIIRDPFGPESRIEILCYNKKEKGIDFPPHVVRIQDESGDVFMYEFTEVLVNSPDFRKLEF